MATTTITTSTLTVVSGDAQTVPRSGSDVPGGSAVFGPLSVLLRDGAGKPMPNQTVTWVSSNHPAAMAVQMDPGGYPFTTTTDSKGVSVLNRMNGASVNAYYAAGPFTIVASTNSLSVTFNLTVG